MTTRTEQFPVITASEKRDFTTVQDLDWQGFLTAHFPGSSRHDLKAITAYSDYKRSRVIEGRSATESASSKDGERISSRAAPVEAWEDEGGAAQ